MMSKPLCYFKLMKEIKRRFEAGQFITDEEIAIEMARLFKGDEILIAIEERGWESVNAQINRLQEKYGNREVARFIMAAELCGYPESTYMEASL